MNKAIDVSGFFAVSGIDVIKKIDNMETADIPESVLNGTEEMIADIGNAECSETEISLSSTIQKAKA